MSKKKYTFIDLFAGCGGLSEGFIETGRFEPLAHVEWEKPMVDTLRNRLVQKWGFSVDEARRNVIQFDLQKSDELINGEWGEDTKQKYEAFNSKEIIENGLKGLVGSKEVDFIIGGPPCQAYSIHGRATDKKSMQEDYRNYLFEHFCRIVKEFSPQVFVFENVAGLLSAKPGGIPVRNRIFEAFSNIGYEVMEPDRMQTTLYNVVDFEVPQNRPRVIILGIKKDGKLNLASLYASINNAKIAKTVCVRDAIGSLPPLYPLNTPIKIGRFTQSHQSNPDKTITQHEARNHGPRERAIFHEWVENNMNHISHKAMIDFYYEKTGHRTLYQKYKSLEWDKPSHTVVAHLSKDGYMFIHPDAKQERSITIREAACLMTFPLDFQFMGSTPYNFRMIGNAVPVKFAHAIAKALCSTLDKELK